MAHYRFTRRFTAAKDAERCTAIIQLRGTTNVHERALCMRKRLPGFKFCKQHQKAGKGSGETWPRETPDGPDGTEGGR